MNTFMGGAIPIGTVWGIHVKIHFIYVIWIGYRLLGAGDYLMQEAIFEAVLFMSVLLHEFGHCAGARWMKGDAKEVVLWPLGGLAMLRYPAQAKAEFVATAAGPAVNLILFVVGIVLLMLVPQAAESFQAGTQPTSGAALVVLIQSLALVNFILFAFNILPAYPMDGGKIFRAMLWAIPPVGWRRATLIATVTAMAFGLGFVALAPLFGGAQALFLVFIGATVVLASFREFQRAKAHRSLPDLDDDRMPHERP